MKVITDFMNMNGLKYLLNWLSGKLYADQVRYISDAVLASRAISESLGEIIGARLKIMITPELVEPIALLDSHYQSLFEMLIVATNSASYGAVKMPMAE